MSMVWHSERSPIRYLLLMSICTTLANKENDA